MNKIILTGIVGKEPQCTITKEKSLSIAKFSLAVKRERDKEKTDWFNITSFIGVENFIKPFVHKGSKLLVSGSFQFDEYEKDGETKTSTCVIADKIEILSSKNDNEETQEPVEDTSSPIEDDDDAN